MTKADVVEDVLRLCREPFFEGMLSRDEADIVPMLIEKGLVRRVYLGAAGFLGLAKIETVK